MAAKQRLIFTEADVERMKELYGPPDDPRMSIKDVAKIMHCCESTVHLYFRRYNVPRHPRDRNIGLRASQKYPKDDGEQIDFLYWGCGMTMTKVGKAMGLSPSSVALRMDYFGIPKRSHAESISIGCRSRVTNFSPELRERYSERMKERWASGEFDELPAVGGRARWRKK